MAPWLFVGGRIRTWIAAGIAFVLLAAAVAGTLLAESLEDEAPGFLWRDASVALVPVASIKGVHLGEPFADAAARLGNLQPANDAGLDVGARRSRAAGFLRMRRVGRDAAQPHRMP